MKLGKKYRAGYQDGYHDGRQVGHNDWRLYVKRECQRAGVEYERLDSPEDVVELLKALKVQALPRVNGRGRPRVMTAEKEQRALTLYKDKTCTVAFICKKLGISRSTLYHHLKGHTNRQVNNGAASTEH